MCFSERMLIASIIRSGKLVSITSLSLSQQENRHAFNENINTCNELWTQATRTFVTNLRKRRIMSQTLDDYQAAIGEHFPGVCITTLDYLSEGWESVACLVNGHLVFLFPKRDMAEHYLRTEIRL